MALHVWPPEPLVGTLSTKPCRDLWNQDFLFDPHLWHADYQSSYSATGKTVSTWNISRIFIVLRPIIAKIRTCEQATNHKLINVLACGLVFSHLIGFFLATQQHSRNISGVDGFSGLTGSVHLLRFFFVSTQSLYR